MQSIIINNLAKTYPEGKQAIKNLSLSLGQGEVFGFMGPNGAGKTTTVRILTGVLSPTSGSCEVMGIDPSREPEKVQKISGIVTEKAQMYDDLTGLENLQFYASLFDLPKEQGKERAEYLLRELDLEEAKDRKVGTYSTGMQQRLSMARALIHRPQMLFLDEPTSGLDPENAHKVNSMIAELAKKDGVTVFLCTHQLRYAQGICSSYGLTEDGSLMAVGTLEELRNQAFNTRLLKICADSVPADLLKYRSGKNVFEVEIKDEMEIPQIVRQIVNAGGNIYSVEVEKPSLEDIYFALSGSRKGEN